MKQPVLKIAQSPNQTTAQLLNNSNITKVIVPLNLLLIVAFTFYDTFLTSPQFRCCDYDLNVFRYIGMIIAKGGRPYLDVFDHKPPLIYIFTALTYPLGPWGFWVFERIIVSLTSIALYLFLRKRSCPWPFVQTLIFLCLMGLPTIYISSGFTRLFTACFNLLAFLLLSGTSKNKYLLAGMLGGAVFMLQQNEVLALLGWVSWLAFREGKVVASYARFLAGAVILVFPITLWLALKGALAAFIEQAFIFNFTYISTSDPWFSRVVNLGEYVLRVGLLIPLLVALSFIPLARFPHPLSDLRWPALTIFGLELLAISFSGRLYGHYFFGLVPVITLLLAIGMSGISVIPKPDFSSTVKAGALLLVFLAAYLEPYTFAIAQSGRIIQQFPQRAEADRANDEFQPYFGPIAGEKEQLLVWANPNRLQLNIYFEITSPGHWVYIHLWDQIPDFDRSAQEFTRFLEDITAARTKYILDYSLQYPMARAELQTQWQQFLSSNYSKVQTMSDRAILWRRN